MTVYQKSVQQERERALQIGRSEGKIEGKIEGIAEGIVEGSTNTMYSIALLLSRKDNCSFESVLEKLEVPEAERMPYLERYSKEFSA